MSYVRGVIIKMNISNAVRILFALSLLFLLPGCLTQTTIVYQNITISTQNNETSPQLPSVKIEFINVGQGDAILIIDNTTSMLIDCGKATYGPIVTEHIQEAGIKRIDYLIFSHMDSDHIGGCVDVIENVPINVIVSNTDTKDTKSVNNVLSRITYQIRHNASEGDVYSLYDSKFRVVQALDTGDSNAQSIIGLYTYQGKSVLFTGDCDNSCETSLSSKSIKSDILKVSHHGSKYATSLQFLESVKPTYAVISVGTNSYGHPTIETINRLAQENVQVFRTDYKGDVIFDINQNQIKVE